MSFPVAITATASRCALGDTDQAIDEAMAAGRSAVAPVRGFDASGFGDVQAAQLWTDAEGDEDDPQLRILGPHGRILEHVVREAYGAADLADLPRERIGLYVALGMVDASMKDLAPAAASARTAEGGVDLTRFFKSSYRLIHPLWPLSMLNNVALGQIATDLDIRGDNLVLASDASSGVRAILEAARAVSAGVVDAAIAAGVSERVCPAALARRALEGDGRPPGEGGAAVVLRRVADAGGALAAQLAGGATAFGSNAAARAVARAGVAPVAASDMVSQVGDLGAGHAAFALTRFVRQGKTGVVLVAGPGRSAGALGVEHVA